jgi:putative phosphoribosyl transferase
MDAEHPTQPPTDLDLRGDRLLRSALHLPRPGAPVLVLASQGPTGLPVRVLWEAGIGTLCLGCDPEGDADVLLLAHRFCGASRLLRAHPATAAARIGYAGRGPAGVAALVAAAQGPRQVTVLAALSAPLHLAGDWLPRVEAPTLLVVGGRDPDLVHSALQGRAQLGGGSRLDIVAGAGGGFEEDGALEMAVHLLATWSAAWLRPSEARGVCAP